MIASERYVCITRCEWRRIAAWSAVVLLLTSSPVIAGYLLAGDERVFVGAVHNLADTLTYLAKMQQGYAGSWSFQLPFTSEPHPAIALLYLPYLFLGHVARWTAASLPWVYHSARLLCAAFFLWAAYRFVAFVLPEPAWRWTAFLLATISGGFGIWLAVISGSFAPPGFILIDLWRMGYYTFAQLLSSPHHLLGLALFFIIVQNVVTYWETASPRQLAIAGAAALAEGFILPFVPLIYGLVLAVAWACERRWRVAAGRTAGAVLLVVMAPLPIVLYHWSQMQQHPVWASFASQDVTLSPHIWDYLLGYGLVGILALPGAWWAWRSGKRGRLLIVMVVVSLVLAYLPVNFQRRLIAGAHLPLSILAAAGIHGWLVPLWRRRRPALPDKLIHREALALMSMVSFSAMSSIYVLLSMLLPVVANSPELYVAADTMAGVRWLAVETSPDAAILSAFSTGQLIPAYAGRRTFWGHPTETPFIAQKQALCDWFFSGAASDAERRRALQGNDIDYFFYGPDERASSAFDPGSAPYLAPVFQDSSVTIYKVDPLR